MTVTPIHNRPASRPGAQRRPRLASPPVWTLTFDVKVTGDADPAVLELIRELSRVADRTAPAPHRLLRIDPLARSIRRGSTTIELSRLEFDLLLYLAEHPGRAFTREHLLERIWRGSSTGTRTVDVHVRRLRVKIGDGPLVTTVRSIGYRLADGVQLEIVTG
jgi:DNA-binding response OmpR family regulator